MENFVLFVIAGFVGGAVGGAIFALSFRLTRYYKMHQRQIDDLKRELEELKRKE